MRGCYPSLLFRVVRAYGPCPCRRKSRDKVNGDPILQGWEGFRHRIYDMYKLLRNNTGNIYMDSQRDLDKSCIAIAQVRIRKPVN